MAANPVDKCTWNDAIAQLRAAPPDYSGEIDVTQIEHPLAAGMISTESPPVGQRADFRKILDDGTLFHVRDFGGHYVVQIEAAKTIPRPSPANPLPHSTVGESRTASAPTIRLSKGLGASPALIPELVDPRVGAVAVNPTSLPALVHLPRDASGVTIIASTAIGTIIGAALGGKDGAAVGALIGAGAALAAVAVDNADSSPNKTKAATRVLEIGGNALGRQPALRTEKKAAAAQRALKSASTSGHESKKKQSKRRSSSNI